MGDTEAKEASGAVRVLISGRVQNVGFRDWLVVRARSRGLRGFVRNRRDGIVEALAVGPERAIAALVEDCHRGPPAAKVDTVTTSDGSTEPWPHDDFRRVPTL